MRLTNLATGEVAPHPMHVVLNPAHKAIELPPIARINHAIPDIAPSSTSVSLYFWSTPTPTNFGSRYLLYSADRDITILQDITHAAHDAEGLMATRIFAVQTAADVPPGLR